MPMQKCPKCNSTNTKEWHGVYHPHERWIKTPNNMRCDDCNHRWVDPKLVLDYERSK